MLQFKFRVLALAGAFVLATTLAHAQFADSVTSYNPGTGFVAGYTNTSAALGAPALSGVTPFAPPFSKSQLVSIGAGGEITMQFNTPILNNPADPYGINFIVFANSFFVSSGGNVSGLFSHAVSGEVQVSEDGLTWFNLNPALAPAPGQLFPTDGAGNPQVPVNPSLTINNFTGQNLAGIESLYAGSAGGTGYDLAWAEDGSGNSVNLPYADFVRIEVQSGVLDLDAVSETAVPEASSTVWLLALGCGGLFWFSRRNGRTRSTAVFSASLIIGSGFVAGNLVAGPDVFTEKFTNNPAADGWLVYGDTNLFGWDPVNHDLAVTWNSAQPNSYFYHPLPMPLTRWDDFSLAFDLNLSSVQSGATPGKPSIFELAVGFINATDALQSNYFRGADEFTPQAAVNLFEFDYFPDFIGTNGHDYGTTVGPTIISSDGAINYDGDTIIYPDLATNVVYHIQMTYTASNQTCVTVMTANGQPFDPIYSAYLPDAFDSDEDFLVDQVAVCSYNDGGQDPMYPEGSILAQGTVANFSVTTPPPVAGITSVPNGSACLVQFHGRTNWLYTLERSSDLQHWTPACAPITGNYATLTTLQDTNPPATQAFYMVKASQ